jgi:uncharacterized YigZ family protein
MLDTFKTISAGSEGCITEQRSKFLAFAVPVETEDEAKEKINDFRKKYYDARHVCWAYMLGAARTQFRVNDDGEPSSTAGKPILGVINSNELTNILIVVVRYFGGVKLGTSGLIVAYRAAAQNAVANGAIIEKTVDEEFTAICDYTYLNGIMKIIKDEKPRILSQQFGNECSFRLCIRAGAIENLKNKLLKIETLRIME